MFLRATIRKKDGKEHRYWSLVENKRVSGGRVLQRHVLYLGEINSSQELAWRKSIEVLEDGADAAAHAGAVSGGSLRRGAAGRLDRAAAAVAAAAVPAAAMGRVLAGAASCGSSCSLIGFGRNGFRASRKGTRWDLVLFVLVAYRLIAPGSEWRLSRHWYEQSALADLAGRGCVAGRHSHALPLP